MLASLLLSRGARPTPSSRLTSKQNDSQFFIPGFFNSLSGRSFSALIIGLRRLVFHFLPRPRAFRVLHRAIDRRKDGRPLGGKRNRGEAEHVSLLWRHSGVGGYDDL
ncbi:MAG TPA: hypothetical protein PK648_03315, partial [Verrucomicrobiales bacterium]|nr:hypothetical protein [Verrucomicrobiales bacterium]